MPPALQVLSLTGGIHVATYRNLLFVHFREASPATCVTAWQAGVAAIAKTGEKAVFFSLVEATSVPPDDAARRAYMRFFEDHRDALASFVMVILEDGFRGAMIRTIVAAILSVMPRVRLGFPRHLVKTLEEAAGAALACSPGLDTAATVQAFRTFCEMPPKE